MYRGHLLHLPWCLASLTPGKVSVFGRSYTIASIVELRETLPLPPKKLMMSLGKPGLSVLRYK